MIIGWFISNITLEKIGKARWPPQHGKVYDRTLLGNLGKCF
jgi:hypothetical protein